MLLDKLRLREGELEDYFASPKSRSNGAAYVAGTRLLVDIAKEIDALEHPAGSATVDPLADADDVALLEALETAIAELPDEAIDRIQAAIHLRITGRPLRIAESA
jgi:hypothetical protein